MNRVLFTQWKSNNDDNNHRFKHCKVTEYLHCPTKVMFDICVMCGEKYRKV